MTLGARQIGDVAVGAVLHRLGVALSVDVAIVLIEAASAGAAGNTQQRQLAAAKRGLAVMQADAMRLQRRVAQYEAQVAQWQTRSERALLVGDEALARQALARKRQLQHIVEQYADTQTAQQRSLTQVQAVVAQMDARIRTVQVGRGSATLLAARDHLPVEAHFEQFELDQAMDALRRTVQG